MPDKSRQHKLSAKQQLEVCKMLALGYTPERVVQELKDEYEVEVTRINIRTNYLYHKKKKIARLRDKMESQIMHHPALKKGFRLDALSKALHEAFMWRVDKVVYDKNGNEIVKIEKRQLSTIASLSRELRIEAEGEKSLTPVIQISIINKIHNIVDSKKEKEESAEPSNSLVTRESFDIVE